MANLQKFEIRTGLYFNDEVYNFLVSMAGDCCPYLARDYDNEVYFQMYCFTESDFEKEKRRLKRYIKRELKLYDDCNANGIGSLPLNTKGGMQIGMIIIPDAEMLRKLHVLYKMLYNESLKGCSEADIAELKGVKLDDTKATAIKKIIHTANEDVKKLQKSKDTAFKVLKKKFDNIFNKIENEALSNDFGIQWISDSPRQVKLIKNGKNEKTNQFKIEAYKLIYNELSKECKNYNNEWNNLEASYHQTYKDMKKKYSDMAKSIGSFTYGTVEQQIRTIL